MGLLDEAIREHLELKRRRGADPSEVERAEREALGPVRRHPEPLEEGPLADPAGVEEELGYEFGPEEEPVAGEAREPGFDPLAHAEPEFPAAAPDQPSADPGFPPDAGALRPAEPESAPAQASHRPDEPESTPAQASHRPDEPGAPSEPAIAPVPAPHPAPDLSEEHGGQETVEYQVGFEEHGEAAAEDVLEETPEFLQDTPDHDRLWFEQRPPRDFDFDS